MLTPAGGRPSLPHPPPLKAEGKTVILITHKLREIMAVTDSVSVMRRGEMVATRKTAETSPERARRDDGRPPRAAARRQGAGDAGAAAAWRDLGWSMTAGVAGSTTCPSRCAPARSSASPGVAGNGQSELLQVMAGIRRHRADGPPRRRDVGVIDGRIRRALRAQGIAQCPRTATAWASSPPFEDCENSLLGYHDEPTFAERSPPRPRGDRDDARATIEKYDIRPPDRRCRPHFSGGNQQKIVLAREIEHDPEVLLVGQPTRGVDIGAIEFIHRRIVEMRDPGKAILLVSVELDEIKRPFGPHPRDVRRPHLGERGPEASEQDLGLMMAGVETKQAVNEHQPASFRPGPITGCCRS